MRCPHAVLRTLPLLEHADSFELPCTRSCQVWSFWAWQSTTMTGAVPQTYCRWPSRAVKPFAAFSTTFWISARARKRMADEAVSAKWIWSKNGATLIVFLLRCYRRAVPTVGKGEFVCAQVLIDSRSQDNKKIAKYNIGATTRDNQHSSVLEFHLYLPLHILHP
jgi:hypothetical protein